MSTDPTIYIYKETWNMGLESEDGDEDRRGAPSVAHGPVAAVLNFPGIAVRHDRAYWSPIARRKPPSGRLAKKFMISVHFHIYPHACIRADYTRQKRRSQVRFLDGEKLK